MRQLDALFNDFNILRQMLRGLPRHGTHAQNLQAFYQAQARGYDDFRERLLHGRDELIARMPAAAGTHMVELGAGTGRNLDFFGSRLNDGACFDLVDLCPALLQQAHARWSGRHNVRIIEADATNYTPDNQVDAVYFSYALTMMPDWRAALRNAIDMVKPGGIIGVVDFYHSAARPGPGLVRHGALTRAFWPRWFAHDGVRLDPAHLATLREWLPRHELLERRARLPYLPWLRVPYYVFVGYLDR